MGLKHSEHFGVCTCCGRNTALTFHHLIPRKLHRRTAFKKKYGRDELNQGIAVCRLCHNGIHDLYTEMQLAKAFISLQALLADPALQLHFAWVAKQK
ncbi:HNH endonuclease [uncultured Thiothrix sp.]|uniref:HNH endonuclease n=1 Tax=uncultured Thiothrix sp. TaxID=223185 RepID=UPI0026121E62|nr:HNH endonuclease [uncultured Thiothrix sp.]